MWVPTIQFGLPLLARELVEQAARRRTYIIRVTYAVLLFGIAWCLFYDLLRGTSAMATLGRGRQMFDLLLTLQYFGVYLFMPALGATSIAVEKERSTFALLLLTRLSPSTIVFEKLLSRMVPMASFLLLGLPLLGFTYTLGGFQMSDFAFNATALIVALVQTASLALFCSAFCRTSTGALISAYVLQFALMVGPLMLAGFARGNNLISTEWFEAGWLFCAPTLRQLHVTSNLAPFSGLIFLPLLGVTALSLIATRVVLVWRAFSLPQHRLQKLFRGLDGLFHRLNRNRCTRGIILIRESAQLPETRPIAWVETTRTVLGSLRYLVRMLLVVEALLGALLLLIAMVPNDVHEIISMLVFTAWIGAIGLVAVKGASLISAERSRQTLDVLLTMPISSRELISQKLSGIYRLMAVVSVPLLTLFLFDAWWRQGPQSIDSWNGQRFLNPALYLTSALLDLVIYLNLTAWLSIFIGLRSRSQTRAVLMSLGAVVALCVGPLLLLFLVVATVFRSPPEEPFTLLLLTSPMMSVIFNEFNAWREVFDATWLAVALNAIYYGVWWGVLRAQCLWNAPTWLGRTHERPTDDDRSPDDKSSSVGILAKQLQPAGEKL
jgi:ABC-type transport system involved in multi-copper enzyme maturation permease subunit